MAADVNGKAENLKKIREVANRFQEHFLADKYKIEKVLNSFKVKYENITNMLNNKVREYEVVKIGHEKKIKTLNEDIEKKLEEKADLQKQIEKFVKEKAEIENKLENYVKENQTQTIYIKELEIELNKSTNMVEIAILEKNEMEKKLIKFQDHWDNYVAVGGGG